MNRVKEFFIWVWIIICAVAAFIFQNWRIRNLKEEARQAEENISRMEANEKLLKETAAKQQEANRKARERRKESEEKLRQGSRTHFEDQ